MKVILIEEYHFKTCRDMLEQNALKLKFDSSTPDRCGINKEIWDMAIDEVYRSMNYQFVIWAKNHGANCI